MTLGEFAYVIDAEPKWVQNVAAALDRPLPYTLASARQLVVARALNAEAGMPVGRAYRVAERALDGYDGSRKPVAVSSDDGSVTVRVDLYRLLASVSAGMSRLAVLYAPKQRGRPARHRNAIRAARDYGLDLTLLQANLRRSPAERLRLLDQMVEFRQRVRRAGHATAITRTRRQSPRAS
jgi:hypothetical protein